MKTNNSNNLADKLPIVSVCVVTFNHAQYIEACLESMARQNTQYAYEIIVGVDPSTDGTEQIVDGVAKKYPSLFKVLHHSKRLGAVENFRHTHKAATGEFVVHMDGDDLAYPNKIEQQVKALQENEDVSVCGHVVDLVTDHGAKMGLSFPADFSRTSRFLIDDALVKGSLFAHSSFMYRRKFSAHLFGGAAAVIDYFFLLGFLRHGPALCIASTLGAYRIVPGSLTHQWARKKRLSLFIDAYEYLLQDEFENPGLVLAATMADSGLLLFKDREVFTRFMQLVVKYKTIPDFRSIAQIRRERYRYGKVIHNAIAA
jgi:glycosyltransferase involved in cell wall biosynthesis